jgi:effector-binding domain-containing protein/carbon monoxide dehydrogenase subunit G
MNFLKKLLIFLAGLVAVLVGVAFFLPDSAHVERSVTIARPASEVFAVLNSFRRFNDWSPWFDLDPQAKYTYSGPVFGVGAKSSWAGNKAVGTGNQEILESKPNESVKTLVEFGDMGKSTGTFQLTPVADGTQVVWKFDTSFDGKLVSRYFGLMMDSMIGTDYAKGLAKLKTLVESFPATDLSGVQGEEVQRTPQKIYFITASSGTDAESPKAVLTDAYMKIGAFMRANGIAMQGAPLTVTTSYDSNGWKFDAAIPVDRNDVAAGTDLQAGTTYAGKAVQFIHRGPYDKLSETIPKAYAWLNVEGYKPKDRLIEEYISDPGNTPVDQLQTRLVFPVE